MSFQYYPYILLHFSSQLLARVLGGGFLEESLSRLGLQKLSINKALKIPWQDLEDEIKQWIKAANVSLRILFPIERRFVDRVFYGLSSAADLSFMEVCRGLTIQILNFTDAVVIGSRSPERLFKVLDVFDYALLDARI
ncbi:putative exocyst complex component Exo70, cullin repeat-like-containing domain-containing protein [Rosa chinensis]|uniref:Exocyst subunit Exo70 family protein n=1 Tax=Rosa chinensis TaxID=74649 RepID=A0A2P6Q326_ROSCH|nr:putative exocyst complex component Exo70, cullin repeat-like-containing domain-containing protein [Rosa chinensis]